MKTINLTELPDWDYNWTRYHGAPLDLTMCKDVARIEDGDAIGIKPDDGKIQFLVLRNRITPELEKLARPVCRFVSKRGTAAHRKVASGFEQDPEASSVVMGYFERHRHQPYCRACPFNIDYPQLFNRMNPYIQRVDEVYRKNLPDIYEIQNEAVSKTKPEWVIPGTGFTTVTINKNWRTFGHPDEGNLKGAFSAMTCMAQGLTGGELIFPRFQCAVEWGNGDVLLTDASELHGNAPFLGLPGQFERITNVLYFRERMTECGTKAEELDRLKHL